MGERVYADCKVRWNTVVPGEPVQSHKHNKGHVTVVVGDVVMKTPYGDTRVINDMFYVPADLEHSIHANIPSKYFCVGDKDF
jgi:quercetin dioxygenase-like cupin family protein